MNFNLYYKLYYFTDYYLHLFIMNENDLQIKKNQIYNTRKLKQKNLEDFFFSYLFLIYYEIRFIFNCLIISYLKALV